MTMKKRILMLFTAAAMIITIIPFMSLPVSADDATSVTYVITEGDSKGYTVTKNGESFYSTAADALEADYFSLAFGEINNDDASGYTKIIQLGNGTDFLDVKSDTASISCSCTLTGNVKSSGENSGPKDAIFFLGDGSATVNSMANIFAEGDHCAFDVENGNLNILGGTLSAEQAGKCVIYCPNNETHITVDGGTVLSKGENGCAIWLSSPSSVNVKSGLVKATGAKCSAIALKDLSHISLIVSGGTVQAEGDECDAIWNKSSSAVNVTGGNVIANGNNCLSIYNYKGKVNISGGNLSAKGTKCATIFNDEETGNINITGGNLYAEGTLCAAIYNYEKAGAINVTGGTLSAIGTDEETRAIYCEPGAAAATVKAPNGKAVEAGDDVASARIMPGFDVTSDENFYKFINISKYTPISTEPKYKITKGADGEWNGSAESGLEFTADGEYKDFLRVEIDGEIINSPEDYTSREGSTIVTLTPEYLATLGEGTHVMKIVFRDDSVATRFSIKKVEDFAAGEPMFIEEAPISLDMSVGMAVVGIVITMVIGTAVVARKRVK